MNDADDADAGDDGGGDDGDTEEEGCIVFDLPFLTKVIDDPFAEVGSDIDLETGDALGGDGGDGGGDGGGKNESTLFLNYIWIIDAGDFDDDGGGGDDAVDIEIQNMASDASDDSGSSEASEDFSG